MTYDARTAKVEADIDGVTGDDGELNERDTIKTDVEWIVGGAGADKLATNPTLVAGHAVQHDALYLRDGSPGDVAFGDDGTDNCPLDKGDTFWCEGSVG